MLLFTFMIGFHFRETLRISILDETSAYAEVTKYFVFAVFRTSFSRMWESHYLNMFCFYSNHSLLKGTMIICTTSQSPRRETLRVSVLDETSAYAELTKCFVFAVFRTSFSRMWESHYLNMFCFYSNHSFLKGTMIINT